MKLFLPLLALTVLLNVAVPFAVHAQGIPTIGSGFHIIPDASELDPACPEGAPLSFGAVMQIAQNLLGVAIAFGVLIFVIIMAWAGFLLITSPINPEAKSTARKMLGNAAIGLLITLSAWLIVDFVMKTLYNPNKAGLGPWNSILSGGPACVKETENMQALPIGPITAGDLAIINDWETTDSGTSSSGGGGANCPAADTSKMVAFPASATQGETEKATQTTVNNFLAMRTAALKDGVDLKVVDGYRSDAEQVVLYKRYCSSGTCGAKKVGKPCSMTGGKGSNHNSGEALDLNVGCANGVRNCNTKTYNWLKANGSKWGFRNSLPTDPPHWSPSGS